MKLMTKNKAMELLGIGRSRLDAMLKAGQIKVVPAGDGYLIPEWSLEQCQKNTVDYPINSSSEGKFTTSKYQPSSMDNAFSFEKARIQRTEKKLNNTPQSDLHKSSKMPNTAPIRTN